VVVVSSLLTNGTSLIVYLRESVSEIINDGLRTQDIVKIKEAGVLFRRRMMLQYAIFIAVTTVLNLFFFYFTIVFCSVYHYTAFGLIVSTVECLLFKFCIAETLGPLIAAFLRKYDREGER
jgi:hypothetical protein